ncbi:MAG TPA: hypothetical protein VK306_15930 [Acidimicrobiales bacterium]|nr:hypothetical protein [Acidimicrobiales bacterium]
MNRDARSSVWQSQRSWLVAAVLALSILVMEMVAADADLPFRPLVVFAFLVLGPGLAVTGFLRLADPGTELAVAVPLSLALDAVVAGVMSLIDAWQPTTGLVLSAVCTSVALALQLLQRMVIGVGR